MAIVNSEQEAEALRELYLNFGPDSAERDGSDSEEPVTDIPPPGPTTPVPTNVTVHIGFHDIFIENEYLTVRVK